MAAQLQDQTLPANENRSENDTLLNKERPRKGEAFVNRAKDTVFRLSKRGYKMLFQNNNQPLIDAAFILGVGVAAAAAVVMFVGGAALPLAVFAAAAGLLAAVATGFAVKFGFVPVLAPKNNDGKADKRAIAATGVMAALTVGLVAVAALSLAGVVPAIATFLPFAAAAAFSLIPTLAALVVLAGTLGVFGATHGLSVVGEKGVNKFNAWRSNGKDGYKPVPADPSHTSSSADDDVLRAAKTTTHGFNNNATQDQTGVVTSDGKAEEHGVRQRISTSTKPGFGGNE